MKIKVSEKALNWFRKELTIEENMGIRFYGKVYGSTNVHEGFSVGMSLDFPEHPVYQEIIGGLLFFIEETDEWFFEGYLLNVDYDEHLDEPSYTFAEDQ